MAGKVKKISINAFENATKENYPAFETVAWNELEIVVRRNLSLDEMKLFVDNAVKACFSDPDGAYMPELKDYVIRAISIELYTNISTPADIRRKYFLLYASDIWSVVTNHIDLEQFNIITAAIDDKINHIANSHISAVEKQVSELYGALDNIQDQFSDMFDGVDSGDIKNMINAIAGGEFDINSFAAKLVEGKK